MSPPKSERSPHLRDLSELARHKNEEAQFQTRLNSIHRDYGRLSALIRQLRSTGLGF